MRREKDTRRLLSSALLLVALLAPMTAAAAEEVRVTSTQVRSGKLVVSAGGESYVLEGTFENAKGHWVQFEDGKAVAISTDGGRQARIEKTTIEGGKVAFTTDSGKLQLGDGQYAEQNPTQPRGPEPQPRPNPNAFKVEKGEVRSVWISGSI